jgi:predicted RNA-binding Zn ribbon-like protein
MEFIKTFPKKLGLKFGPLCIDFTNTVFWRLHEEPIEGFKDYSIFLKWGCLIGLLTEPDATHLMQQAEKYPEKASTVLRRVINLREALYRIIVETINVNSPDPGDLDILNSEISEMLQRTELIQLKGKFEWGWEVGENELDQMLWPILISASEMLTTSNLDRIGICEGDGCGWLFYDQSRNRSRKWCDMGDCGNRAKARRFYQRKRANNH